MKPAFEALIRLCIAGNSRSCARAQPGRRSRQPLAIHAIVQPPVGYPGGRLPATTCIVPSSFARAALPIGGGRGSRRPASPQAPAGSLAPSAQQLRAGRLAVSKAAKQAPGRSGAAGACAGNRRTATVVRLTSGMLAIRTHVRAKCEERARLEHTFVPSRACPPGLPRCADILLAGRRIGRQGAVPTLAVGAPMVAVDAGPDQRMLRSRTLPQTTCRRLRPGRATLGDRQQVPRGICASPRMPAEAARTAPSRHAAEVGQASA